METGRLEIRVVSGPNLGATISLEPGIYVVGSHDTCDFILADDTVAPRHLALELIRAEDQTWRVTARPLDGEVFLEGLALPPEGLDLPTGRALALGFTALVWQPPGQDWGPVRLVPLEFLPTAGTAPAPAPEPLPAAEDEDEAPTDPEPAQLEPRLTRRPWFLWLGLAVLATLLVLMLNDWSGGGRQAARAAGELVEALTRENLGGLTVAPSGQDLVVEGELVSDADLVRLVTLARSQPHKVFLRVSVKNDLVRAAREALGAHGFLADVFLKPDGTLVLSAYMRDQRVEDLALENLAREVPSLVIGSRRIVHADELSGALTE